MSSTTTHSILVVNPNTSTSMTTALEPLIASLQLPATIQIDYFTAPKLRTVYPDGTTFDGIASINSGEESCRSAMHVFPHLENSIGNYDGFLVACYSAHPLVGMIRAKIAELEEEDDGQRWHGKRRYVTGIFEASVSMSLSLISHFDIIPSKVKDAQQPDKVIAQTSFGIITTGSIWKEELNNAVRSMLLKGTTTNAELPIFAGVQTTGLSAIDLHTTPAEEVEKRIVAATERLIEQSGEPVSGTAVAKT
ncbi:gamma-tubulin [Ascosphaera pollenicola]|nr:gamma-tubulin [Ascosphaera pollenicola]